MSPSYPGTMSIAAEARDAARDHPFLLHALRAGVVNYAAAAEFLDTAGDTEAVATALRRFADELPGFETRDCDARVTMQSGVGLVEGADRPLLAVAGYGVVPDAGSLTAVVASGDVDARALGAACSRLAVADVEVEAAGVVGDSLVVVVGRRRGATTVRVLEAVLENVPV